jgi:hypothetical protein
MVTVIITMVTTALIMVTATITTMEGVTADMDSQ